MDTVYCDGGVPPCGGLRFCRGGDRSRQIRICPQPPARGGRRGHPAALDAAYRGALLDYGGEGGLRGAVRALRIPLTEVEVDDEGMHLDLDTPEDYAKVLRLLEREKTITPSSSSDPCPSRRAP